MRKRRSALTWSYLKRLLALDGLAAAAVAAVCWIIGWRSVGLYGMGLILGGLLLLVLMGMSSVGGTEHLKDPGFLIARSVGGQTPQERFRADLEAVRQSVDMSLALALVSLSLIGLGGLLLVLA